MKLLRLALAWGLSVCALAVGFQAGAQTYPDRPIRLVVPYPPGGVGDSAARAVATRLAQRVQQPVIVENRPGGMQIIASEIVAKAAPDGYTLLLGSVTNLVLNAVGGKPLNYDPKKDFVPVSRLFQTPLFLMVPVDIPVQSVAELVDYARGHPGRVNFASVGLGTSTHLAGEMFKNQAKLDIVHVPYKGSGPAILGLLGGETQMMFDGGTSALAQSKAGKLRVLAITSAARSASQPDVPTMQEAGISGYEITPWWGIVAPAKTPRPVVERLAAEIQAIVQDPALTRQFANDGVEFAASTPDGFATFIHAQTEHYRSFIARAGIKFE